MKLLKLTALITLFSSLFLTTGCAPFVENNTIEEISPVIFWYISRGEEENKYKISTLVPPVIKEKKSVLSLQVDLIKQGGKEFNLIYYRELKPGQTRMVLLDEEVARRGVTPIINTLLTDPDISQRLYFIIVRGDFDQYLQSQLNNQPDLDYFLYRMMRHYEKYHQGEMAITNLHEFKSKLYSPFPYPTLPVFRVNGSNFSYLGTAVFEHDRLVSTLTKMDDQVYQLIDHDHYLKYIPIPPLLTTVGHIRAKVHQKLDPSYKSLSLRVDVTARIEEYRGDKNIVKLDQFYGLRDEIESYLEENTKSMLRKMQRLRLDPIQYGLMTLSPFTRPMSEDKWISYWEDMNIDVKYNLKLVPLTNQEK